MHNITRIILVAVALLLAACGEREIADAAGAQRWKFAIEEIEGSVQHQYAMEFKRQIERRSGGRIEVTVYPYGQLGTSSQLTELVQLGAVELAMASPGHLGAVIPQVQLFSLHFVFSDDEAVNRRILDDNAALRAELEAAYRGAALHYLGAFQEGWMAWTANRAIRTPADFRGVKIRTMNSPLLIRAYELYGASPVTMAYSEVYSGLQLNMIDAQVNPVFAIEEMSFYEVQTHLMMARHLPFIATVVTNPEFFDSLAAADRALLVEVIDELQEYIFEVQRQLNEERLSIIAAGSDIAIIELTDAERAAFRAASLPIRDEYVQHAGASGVRLLATLLAALEADKD